MPEQDSQSLKRSVFISHNWVYLREQDRYDVEIVKVFVSVNLDREWVRQHTRVLHHGDWVEDIAFSPDLFPFDCKYQRKFLGFYFPR